MQTLLVKESLSIDLLDQATEVQKQKRLRHLAELQRSHLQ